MSLDIATMRVLCRTVLLGNVKNHGYEALLEYAACPSYATSVYVLVMQHFLIIHHRPFDKE